jgi:hypothetical protein
MLLNKPSNPPSVRRDGLLSRRIHDITNRRGIPFSLSIEAELNELMLEAKTDQIGSPRSDAR